MNALKEYLYNINLFAPPLGTNEQEDEQQRRWNIIATRVYLISLILILFGIGLAFWYITQTTIITVTHPTREQFENLPSNAKCLCSQISIPYGKFTSLETRFHQMCSSDFVSDRWLHAIYSGANSTNYVGLPDFLVSGSAQFQSLAAFCRLSQANVNQSITSFSLNTLLSPEILPESVLRSQSQASIGQFQSTASTTFKSQLRLVNRMTVSNRLTSGLKTNAFYEYAILADNTIIYSIAVARYGEYGSPLCLCDIGLCSYIPSGVLRPSSQPDTFYFYVMPGISKGCLPITSMLVSSLECFYDQTCVDALIKSFPTSESFTAMIIDEESHYNQTSSVQSMLDNLMIEEWTTNISYDEYYSQCAPLSCTYSEVSRHDFLFILTKLISVLSGLTLILGIFIPLVVQFIRRLKNPAPTPTPRVSLCVRLRQLKALVQKKLVELNTFQHYPSTDRQIRNQRYATRLYIFLVICSLIVLVIYTSIDTQLQSKTVLHPTLSQYLELEQDYPETLSCSCTSITQSYSTFITIQPHYHQLCSSDLISQQWIKYIQLSNVSGQHIDILDYRAIALSQFQSLSMFCQQAQQTIDDALTVFLQIQFVSAHIVSQASIEVQINSLIEDWKLATTNTFMRTIQLILATTEGNQLLNGLYNSYVYSDYITNKTSILTQQYNNCKCALSPLCYITIGIYYVPDYGIPSLIYSIPNFFIGCYPIEALLASTLECFYNISCMLEIDRYLYSSISFNFSALNPDLNWPNETIESIVNRLTVDTWSSNMSFPSYYDACAPSSCSFQYVDRSNFLIIITTIIGIFGGVSLGFQLIITIALQFIDKAVQNGISRWNALNLIKHMFTCATEHQLRHRLHFILLIVILCILYVFSALTTHTRTVQVDKPSLSIYKDLLAQSHDSLQCPCSQISIRYKSFLNVQPRFYEICSSDFVSDQWIVYLYSDSYSVYFYPSSDFLHSGSSQFQLLASFCRLSQQTVNDSLLELGARDFINTQLLSPSSLDDRIQTKINEFQLTISQSFVNSLSLIRETTGANMLMNTLSTSWMLVDSPNITDKQVVPTVPLEYDGCSCALSSTCVSSSRGMLAGCYPLESILQSTLECLYDQQCIGSTNPFQAMNISSLESSRFPVNANVESIVNELMVEELLSNVSYELYFDECAPMSCVYSYVGHNSLIQGLTTLISLYGGLMIICRVLAIVTVQVYACRRQRVAPIVD